MQLYGVIICFLFFLRDKNSTSNMKIDTLSFLSCILTQHPPAVFHPHIHVLLPVSCNGVLVVFELANWLSSSERGREGTCGREGIERKEERKFMDRIG